MSRFIIITGTILLAFVFVSPKLMAQRSKKPNWGKKSTSFYKGKYNNIRMSPRKAKVVCPIFEDSKYPYHGFGFKIGDPFALTYKFYASKHFAIAIDGGSAASGLYSEHHRENFSKYFPADTLVGDQSISYLGHTVKTEWVIEGKVMFQNDASELLKGLQWYVGAGWQAREVNIDYEYLLEISFAENEIGKTKILRTTMGPVGTIGIEYAYFEIPISAFLEVEGYYDVVENPGWLRLQGGVGLRYVF